MSRRQRTQCVPLPRARDWVTEYERWLGREMIVLRRRGGCDVANWQIPPRLITDSDAEAIVKKHGCGGRWSGWLERWLLDMDISQVISSVELTSPAPAARPWPQNLIWGAGRGPQTPRNTLSETHHPLASISLSTRAGRGWASIAFSPTRACHPSCHGGCLPRLDQQGSGFPCLSAAAAHQRSPS